MPRTPRKQKDIHIAQQQIQQFLSKSKEKAMKAMNEAKERSAAAAGTDVLVRKLQDLFTKVASMSDAAWTRFLKGIGKAAGWTYGKDGEKLSGMKRETFIRKTRSYLASLDPAEKVGLAGGLVVAIASGGLMAPFIASAHGRGFVNHLAEPDPGQIYLMKATMPDGETDIKGGQTTRSPEIRAEELASQRGGEYEVIASKEVPDVDAAEAELLGMLREHLGTPDVGREQWDLDIDIDPIPMLASIEGGPLQTHDTDGDSPAPDGIDGDGGMSV